MISSYILTSELNDLRTASSLQMLWHFNDKFAGFLSGAFHADGIDIVQYQRLQVLASNAWNHRLSELIAQPLKVAA